MNRSFVLFVILFLAASIGGWGAWFKYRSTRASTSASHETGALLSSLGNTKGESNPALVFRDVELPFQYERGDSGSAWPVEPVGGGVGIGDFDGDGRPDLFFAQGVPLPVGRDRNAPVDVLLRNAGQRSFEDVSTAAGLTAKGYGIGVTVADYDADGFPDVYVTRYGANTLLHNEGDGSFRDVTVEAAVGCELWSLGAAFADFDRDGDLDLFVATYFWFDPADAPFARDRVTGAADYGAPAHFDGQPDVLYRNDGDGHFCEITATAGIADEGRGMGVLATDFDGDGWMDIFVANDAQNNILWHNTGAGSFADVALSWGVAVNARGEVEANMGIAYGDTDGDGAPDILVSHLVGEHDTLWRGRTSQGGGVYFQDDTVAAGLSVDSRALTGWGTTFADFDHDGWLDLIVVNGHIRREPYQTYVYENPPILWRNIGAGRFANVTASAGAYFTSLHQARGLAAGDLDGDNDLDLVVVHHGAPSVVLWNESPRRGHTVLVRLVGTGSNRDAIGARVVARVGNRVLVRSVDGGGGYISSNDAQVHFGLGTAKQIDQLDVTWPSGRRQSWTNLTVDCAVYVRETDEFSRLSATP